MRKNNESKREAFSLGFHGLPGARERAAMSVLQLAEETAKHQKDSTPFIVLSHELNLKLAKEQAKATLTAGWLGAGATLLAVFIAAGLGYLAGASQSKESNNNPRTEHANQPAASSVDSKLPPVAAVATPPVVGDKPAVVPQAQSARRPGK
jgi:hypothetical protein